MYIYMYMYCVCMQCTCTPVCKHMHHVFLVIAVIECSCFVCLTEFACKSVVFSCAFLTHFSETSENMFKGQSATRDSCTGRTWERYTVL